MVGAALVAAAEAASAVAVDVQAAGLAAPIARLGTALPGGATAAAVDALADRWAVASQDLAAAVARHADHLTDSAAHYDGVETAVADGLGAAG